MFVVFLLSFTFLFLTSKCEKILVLSQTFSSHFLTQVSSLLILTHTDDFNYHLYEDDMHFITHSSSFLRSCLVGIVAYLTTLFGFSKGVSMSSAPLFSKGSPTNSSQSVLSHVIGTMSIFIFTTHPSVAVSTIKQPSDWISLMHLGPSSFHSAQ